MAWLVALLLAVGCDAPPDDAPLASFEDTGGDGPGDGGDAVGASCVWGCPELLLMAAATGLQDGALSEVTYFAEPLESALEVTLIWGRGTGLDEPRDFCRVRFATTGAEVDPSCTSCWPGLAWRIDTSQVLDTEGACAPLHPAFWSDDVAGWLAAQELGFGFAPASEELLAALAEHYPTDFDLYAPYILANRVRSSLVQDGAWLELSWALAYQVDENGEIVASGTALLPAAAVPVAPTTYLRGRLFYGVHL